MKLPDFYRTEQKNVPYFIKLHGFIYLQCNKFCHEINSLEG